MRDKPIPLALVELRQEMVDDYAELLPDISEEDWRRTRGAQEIIVEYEQERALETLPQLLVDHGDRERLLAIIDKMFFDERVKQLGSTAEQVSMIQRIRDVLSSNANQAPRLTAVR